MLQLQPLDDRRVTPAKHAQDRLRRVRLSIGNALLRVGVAVGDVRQCQSGHVSVGVGLTQRRFHPSSLKHSMKDAPRRDVGGNAGPSWEALATDNQRYVHQFLIYGEAMPEEAVIAVQLAVVSNDDHQRILKRAYFTQRVKQVS